MVLYGEGRAAGLRQEREDIRSIAAIVCSLAATLVRGRFGGHTPSAARWLRFGFLRSLFLFLISGMPAILDLRQKLRTARCLLTPGMHLQIAQLDGLGWRHFLLAM